MSNTKAKAMDPAQVVEAAEIARNSVIDETIARQESPVQQFYAGAVVLVTGASGFLGKQLIEKLFRSCKIHKMYILLRTKEHKSCQKRADEIVQDKLFENLHRTQPDFVKKIIPVIGDISELDLDLSEEAWNRLSHEVNVIFHVAATINFVEPLKKATLTNVRGTREMLKLAQACKNLKSFVHVSTAFSHATSDRVSQPVLEQFYDVPLSPSLIIQLAEQLDETLIDAVTPHFLGKWPNTYAFTKAIAEEAIRTMSGDLPICIVRPAIVLPAYREPPGWADKSTINGPVGFITGACLGGLHVMFAKPDLNIDMVPVDLVNNAVIAGAYETAERCARGDSDVKIYTVTSNRNSIDMRRIHEYLESKTGRSLNTPKALWHGYVIMTTSTILFFILTWALHFVPGYLVDSILKLSGKKPKVIRLFNKAYKQNKVYGYYMTQFWDFGDSNLVQMYQNLSPEDQIIYGCDVASVDVNRFMPVCCIGVRKYILKDGLENTEYAVKKGHVLRILNYIYLILYAYVIFKLSLIFFGAVRFAMLSVGTLFRDYNICYHVNLSSNK